MRDVIVAANWKMNTTPADAGELARTIASRTREPGVTRVICPPFVCLAAVRDALAESDPDVAVGAQNVHHELAGAYTGEISAPMLAGLATWVIVGHSERRRDAGETDELIGRKLTRAVDAGLRPILCVGEQLAERDAGTQEAVVRRQLAGALGGRRPGAAGRGRARHRLRAGLGDRHGPERQRAGRAAMADAIRAALGRPAWAPRPRPPRRSSTAAASRPPTSASSSPSPPSTARSSAAPRSSPTRWPGSWPAPADRPRTPRRGVTVAPLGAAPPDRPRRPRRVRHRPRPGRRRDRRRPDADLARPARPLAALDARRLGGRRRPAAGPDGQLRGRAPQPRRGPAGPPGPAAHRRRDRRRLVLRAAGPARGVPARRRRAEGRSTSSA